VKVAFTSDLHVDVTESNRLLAPYLARRAAELNPDIFVLAGDVASSMAALEEALAQFDGLDCTKVITPGNHDIWVSKNQAHKGRDSFHNYRQSIPEACSHHGFICPTTTPYVMGKAAIIANIGWYDYSLQDPRLATTYGTVDYDRGVFGSALWNDTRYAVWLRHPDSDDWRRRRMTLRNREVFAIFCAELQAAIEQVPAGVEKLLLVLHTAPFRECITPKPEPSPFDAYEGSTAIGEFIESVVAAGRQAWVICGHRHQPLFLERGDIRLYRSPIGYLERADADYERIARSAVGEFEM
jgi:predicted phosphohydrolase